MPIKLNFFYVSAYGGVGDRAFANHLVGSLRSSYLKIMNKSTPYELKAHAHDWP